MRIAWTAALWLCGCGSWPRWSAAEPTDPLTPTEADAAFAWAAEPTPEAEGSNEGPDASAGTISSGNTFLGEGDLEGVGWCSATNGPACENAPDPGCSVPFGDPGGIYAGDIDTWALDLEGDGELTLCARVSVTPSELENEAQYDLLLIPLDAGCPAAPTSGTDDYPLGWSLGPGVAGWGAPVIGGTRVAVLLAGAVALEGEVSQVFPYTIGFALVPTAAGGGLTHCPLLPGEGAGGDE